MSCKKTKFDPSLFSTSDYLSLHPPELDSMSEGCRRMKRSLKEKRRLEGRPIGMYTVPQRVKDVLKVTVGDPGQASSVRLNTSVNGEDLAKYLKEKPTIWEEAFKDTPKDNEERPMSLEEFCNWRRTRRALIKLIRNVATRMKLLLAIDFNEHRKLEKFYFRKRLEQEIKQLETDKETAVRETQEYEGLSYSLLLMEMATNKDPAIYISNKEMQLITEMRERIQEEVRLVKETTEKDLSQEYDEQLNKVLALLTEAFDHSVRYYTEKWKALTEELKETVNKILEKLKPWLKDSDTEYLEKIRQEIGTQWIKTMNEIRKIKLKQIDDLESEIVHLDEELEVENADKSNVTKAMENSATIVKKMLSEFEKIVVFGFKGQPGKCNYFLSFQKLNEVYERLSNTAVQQYKLLCKQNEGSNETWESEGLIDSDSGSADDSNTWADSECAALLGKYKRGERKDEEVAKTGCSNVDEGTELGSYMRVLEILDCLNSCPDLMKTFLQINI